MAETQAATRALTKALSAGQQKVEVKTSSQNVIKSMNERVANWKRNGWKNAKKKPVDNKEDLIELDRVVESLGRGNVKWTYVKAHLNPANKLAITAVNI